jgi:cell division protein FtsI/penicillin-binding protein 2
VENRNLAKELQHHAWFVGWAPLERPNLVVAAIVEHGGSGGGVAAPIVGQVIDPTLAKPPEDATPIETTE